MYASASQAVSTEEDEERAEQLVAQARACAILSGYGQDWVGGMLGLLVVQACMSIGSVCLCVTGRVEGLCVFRRGGEHPHAS